MTKQEIFDKYAVKQGYESLRDLLRYSDLDEIEEIIDSVTDLIQEELKKKIAEESHFLINNNGLTRDEALKSATDRILNTEIL